MFWRENDQLVERVHAGGEDDSLVFRGLDRVPKLFNGRNSRGECKRREHDHGEEKDFNSHARQSVSANERWAEAPAPRRPPAPPRRGSPHASTRERAATCDRGSFVACWRTSP